MSKQELERKRSAAWREIQKLQKEQPLTWSSDPVFKELNRRLINYNELLSQFFQEPKIPYRGRIY